MVSDLSENGATENTEACDGALGKQNGKVRPRRSNSSRRYTPTVEGLYHDFMRSASRLGSSAMLSTCCTLTASTWQGVLWSNGKRCWDRSCPKATPAASDSRITSCVTVNGSLKNSRRSTSRASWWSARTLFIQDYRTGIGWRLGHPPAKQRFRSGSKRGAKFVLVSTSPELQVLPRSSSVTS